MRDPDDDMFRDSMGRREARRSGFYEPSISTRGSRSLQRKRRRRPNWPWIVFGLTLIGAATMLGMRFGWK
jgi:hypothetical protein